jgi:hypothetical protein
MNGAFCPRIQLWREHSEWPVWEVSCGRRDEEEVLEKRLVGGVVIGWIGLVGVDAKGVGVARSSGFIGGVLLPHPGAI